MRLQWPGLTVVFCLVSPAVARADCGGSLLQAVRAGLIAEPSPTLDNTLPNNYATKPRNIALAQVGLGFDCGDETPQQREVLEATRSLYRAWIVALQMEAVPVAINAASQGWNVPAGRIGQDCGPYFQAMGRVKLSETWYHTFSPSYFLNQNPEGLRKIAQMRALADYQRVVTLYRTLATSLEFELPPILAKQDAFIATLAQKASAIGNRMPNADPGNNCKATVLVF